MEWLQANWLPLLIVVIVVLIFIGIIIYLCKKKGLRQVALQAILFAEEQYNSTTGQERLQIAIDYVYSRLPSAITIILPKDFLNTILKNFIQKLFDEVKQLLDYQKQALEEKESEK